MPVLNSTGDAVSVTPQYDAVKDLWASFAKTGKLPAGSTGPSPVKEPSQSNTVVPDDASFRLERRGMELFR